MAAIATPRRRPSDLEPVSATEPRKKFPPADVVVYNERLLLGSCTDAI
jgi:hypothetical protein